MNLGRVRIPKLNGLLTLMAFVAAIAVSIAGTKYVVERQQKRDILLGVAVGHADTARIFSATNLSDESMKLWQQRMTSYHRQMERKYLEAAKDPWRPIPPDPPEPDGPSVQIGITRRSRIPVPPYFSDL